MDARSEWFKALKPCQQDVVTFHQLIRKVRRGDPLEKHAALAVVDTGVTISPKKHVGTLNDHEDLVACAGGPNSALYVSLVPSGDLSCGRHVHRLLVGEECLMLNGFPTRDDRFKGMIASKSHHWLQELAGSTFASTCIVAIMQAVIFAAEAHGIARAASSRDDTNEVLSRFKKMRKA